jgi:nitroreductase
MHTKKSAQTKTAIDPVIRDRWSPRSFSSRLVSDELLLKLFEAAQWAPSSMNEQPWRFIVASKTNPEEFERALSCLVPSNQQWARHAPVLVLTVVSKRFARNGKPNRTAEHDLGLAAATLSFQATVEGLMVHQMGGVDLDRVREEFAIPEGYDPHTAIAIGYLGDPENLPEGPQRDSEIAPRIRKPLSEVVFGGAWEAPYFKE